MNQRTLEERMSALSRIDSHKQGLVELYSIIKDDDVIPEHTRGSSGMDKKFMLHFISNLQTFDEVRLRELESLETWITYYLRIRAQYKNQMVKG